MAEPFARTPLMCAHDTAGRLWPNGPAHDAWSRASLLPGRRTFGWPVLALTAQRQLGHVRHALAQRVVAGTMTIPPPVVIHVEADASREDADR